MKSAYLLWQLYLQQLKLSGNVDVLVKQVYYGNQLNDLKQQIHAEASSKLRAVCDVLLDLIHHTNI